MPQSDTPPNIAPKVVTSENYLRTCDSSATLIGHLAIVTLSGTILGGIPLSGPYRKTPINERVYRRTTRSGYSLLRNSRGNVEVVVAFLFLLKSHSFLLFVKVPSHSMP